MLGLAVIRSRFVPPRLCGKGRLHLPYFTTGQEKGKIELLAEANSEAEGQRFKSSGLFLVLFRCPLAPGWLCGKIELILIAT
jgi:hypothetical protein